MSNGQCQSGLRKSSGEGKRASYVCQGCRSRKVKCDLAETGAPCRNCLEDESECIEIESRRTRKYRLRQRRIEQDISNKDLDFQEFHDENPQHNLTPDSQSCASAQIPDIQVDVSSLDPEITRFLAARGALTVPGASARNELIKAFALYVHPQMPILDLQDFMDSIHQSDGTNSPPLILLQAIMFAGSAFVDMEVLEKLGFGQRRDARKAFYIKVKYLYDFNLEPDPVLVLQALLLISQWFESPEDYKDPWYWLGACWLIANRTGLRTNLVNQSKPPKTRRLIKRLWWMIIHRDCTIAIATRKPLHFRQQDIQTPMLTLEDMEVQPIKTSCPALRDYNILEDPRIRLALARVCIEQVKLGLLGARILTQMYTPSSSSEELKANVMLYSPNRLHSTDQWEASSTLYHDLNYWEQDLHPDCIFATIPTQSHEWATNKQVHLMHRTALYMLSLMVYGLFYRPIISARAINERQLDFIEKIVKPKLAGVSVETARLAQLLSELGLIQKLPSFVTTCFFSAVPTIVAEINAPSGLMRGNLELHLHWCRKAIWILQDVWPTARFAYGMTEIMVRRARTGPFLASDLTQLYPSSNQARGEASIESLDFGLPMTSGNDATTWVAETSVPAIETHHTVGLPVDPLFDTQSRAAFELFWHEFMTADEVR